MTSPPPHSLLCLCLLLGHATSLKRKASGPERLRGGAALSEWGVRERVPVGGGAHSASGLGLAHRSTGRGILLLLRLLLWTVFASDFSQKRDSSSALLSLWTIKRWGHERLCGLACGQQAQLWWNTSLSLRAMLFLLCLLFFSAVQCSGSSWSRQQCWWVGCTCRGQSRHHWPEPLLSGMSCLYKIFLTVGWNLCLHWSPTL